MVEGNTWRRWTSTAFALLASFGLLLETIADQHKYMTKRIVNEGKEVDGDDGKKDDEKRKRRRMMTEFVGPTDWTYSLCRHPNYLGEILHWIGVFGVGSLSFGASITAWSCGMLGLYAILSIMFGASSRLEMRQSEKYGGSYRYEEWKKRVRWSVVPFVK